MKNSMKLSFEAQSINEALSRTVIAAFLMPLNPTVDELSDIKTAVSEAVTNAIIHGYEGMSEGTVVLEADIDGRTLCLTVTDNGKGIADVAQAMEPFYTSKPEQERSGMGFTVMQTFMDELEVHSFCGGGTTVRMKKTLCDGVKE